MRGPGRRRAVLIFGERLARQNNRLEISSPPGIRTDWDSRGRESTTAKHISTAANRALRTAIVSAAALSGASAAAIASAAGHRRRLPKPPRPPRSRLCSNGGCWVRCNGAAGREPPSAAPDGAARAWIVSRLKRRDYGSASAGSPQRRAQLRSSECFGRLRGRRNNAAVGGGWRVNFAGLGLRRIPLRLGFGRAATWSYSSRCSRKSLT